MRTAFSVVVSLYLYCHIGPVEIRAQVFESRGRLTIHRFSGENTIHDVSEAPTVFSASKGFYSVSMLKSMEFVEQGILVIGNGEFVYQAEKSRQLGSSAVYPPPPPFLHTYAKFERGEIPNAFYGWGPAQALVLTHLLLKKASELLTAENLKREYLPEIILARARENGGLNVTARAVRSATGDISGMLFWGLKPDAKNMTLTHSEDCFLLAELRIDAFEHNLPTKLYFVVNGLFLKPPAGKIPLGAPLVDFIFEGTPSQHSDENVFRQRSFDAGSRVYVTDNRFPDTLQLKYVIDGKEQPPFEEFRTGQPDAAQRARTKLLSEAAVRKNKRKILIGAAATTSLLLGIAILVRRKTNNKKIIK